MNKTLELSSVFLLCKKLDWCYMAKDRTCRGIAKYIVNPNVPMPVLQVPEEENGAGYIFN